MAEQFDKNDVSFLLHKAASYRASATDGNSDWGDEHSMHDCSKRLESIARRIAKQLGIPARVQCEYCDGTGSLYNGSMVDRACFGTGTIPPRRKRTGVPASPKQAPAP